jgi:N-methylhydantoinase B
VSPLTFGPHIRIHPDFELREHICGECGSLLEAEVVRKGDDSLVSVALEA